MVNMFLHGSAFVDDSPLFSGMYLIMALDEVKQNCKGTHQCVMVLMNLPLEESIVFCLIRVDLVYSGDGNHLRKG